MSDDSDFGDEIFLDDDIIAALDAEETKYLHAQLPTAKPAFVRHTPPPAKKQKTHHSILLQPSGSIDEYGDLPEISIQGDGTYGVAAGASIVRPNNGSTSTTGPAAPPVRRPKPVSSGPSSTSTRRPPLTVKRLSGAHITAAPSQTPNGSQRPPPQLQRSRSSIGTPTYPVPSQGQVEQRTELSDFRDRLENPRQPVRHIAGGGVSVSKVSKPLATLNVQSVDTSGFPASQRFGPSQARTSMSAQDKAHQSLRTELNILRTQVEELSKKEADARREVQDARNARFAKEGEVSILRVNIEKINEQHTAELAKLTAAKEAAEAMQAQLRQNMKDELDRIKTQYMFKQHEVETSARKTPAVLRINKNARPSSQTPGIGTPRMLKFATGSPTERRIRTLAAPEKFSAFPGFQSGFEPTPVKVKGKGKEREANPPDHDIFVPRATPSPSPPSSPTRPPARFAHTGDVHMVDPVPFPSADLDRAPGLSSQPPNLDADVEMGDDAKPNEDEGIALESTMEIEPHNWQHELHHIIFTHHSRSTPSQLTLHLVLNTTLADSDVEQFSIFTSHAHRLLEALGAPSTLGDWTGHLNTISTALVTMAHCLVISGSIPALLALLDLIRTLAYSIPSFTPSLLPSPDADDEYPQIVVTIHEIIFRHLISDKEDPPEEYALGVASEVFKLMETLCWSVPDDLSSRLSGLLSDHHALMTIISPSQPLNILVNATRTLAFLASVPVLLKHFITAPAEDSAEAHAEGVHRQLPQVEQLAVYLSDTSREGPEALQLKENILTFIASLLTSHPDALNTLSKSYTLIPSMILFLSNISSPLWEDDVNLMASQDRIATLLLLIARTISLLYYMVCSPSPKLNLSDKLQISHRPFSGLNHVFIVTFGRFSFADAPEWVDIVGRTRLEQLADMARELLALVANGPDLDMMWVAFQPDSEGSKKVPIDVDNDEDEEAFMVHTGSD